MVIVLPNQIIEHRWFSPDFKAIFFAVSKNLLEALPKVGNVLSLFFYLKDYPCFDLTPHEQDIIREYTGPYLVVGDRRQDLECARACKSPFIGCLYGYGESGELNGADRLAEHIEDIPQLVI